MFYTFLPLNDKFQIGHYKKVERVSMSSVNNLVVDEFVRMYTVATLQEAIDHVCRLNCVPTASGTVV